MNGRALKYISVFGQFLSVFPFVVLCEGAGFGEYTWWHYIALFAALAVFYCCGRLGAEWAASPKHSRYFRPKAIFLSRAAIIVPTIIYIIVCASLELSSSLYIYALPAALIMFHGGRSAAGKGYSDIFGRGWFALYFVAAAVTSVILWFTHDESVKTAGGFQLCLAFGVLIIISAVLTNQTNIDTCTHQRDAGRSVLPKGLRGYNGALVAAVVAVIVALCLFAAPLAELVMLLIKQLLSGIIMLLQSTHPDGATEDILSGTEGGEGPAVSPNDNALADILSAVLIIGLIAVIVVFRKQIIGFFRDLIAPLFRIREEADNIAYVDEVSEISEHGGGERSRRKREQQLYKLYRKEADPVKKYRTGYRLMLVRLLETPFPPAETDNTDIHRVKGENGLRSDSVKDIVRIYNDVRYSGRTPTREELAFEERFIEEIRR